MKPAPDSPLTALLARWQAELLLLKELQSPLAPAFRRHSRELAEALEAYGNEGLTLEAAAKLGGFHPGTLSRMVNDGTIPNVGKKHAPRIRRRDVPIKPGSGSDLTPRDLMRIVPARRKSS